MSPVYLVSTWSRIREFALRKFSSLVYTGSEPLWGLSGDRTGTLMRTRPRISLINDLKHLAMRRFGPWMNVR